MKFGINFMSIKRAFFLLLIPVLLTACEQPLTELRLVVPVTPVEQKIMENLSELVARNSDVRIHLTAPPQSGASALDSLIEGRADLALVSNTQPYREGIATLMPLYSTVLHIAYKKTIKVIDPHSIFKDAKVYAGQKGSSSRLIFERIIERFKLAETNFSYVASIKEDPDVIIIFAPISPKRIEKYSDFRLFSLGSPDEVGRGSLVDSAVLLNPQLSPFVIPRGTYGEISEQPVLTVAVDKILVARPGLDKAIAYDLINEILRVRPAMASLTAGLFNQSPDDFDVSRSTFVLHPGTQAYLQRSAPSIYERYAGIAELVVTLMIGFLSAAFAGVKILRMRKKNRIDDFYSKVISIRNEIDKTSNSNERELAADQIRSLQNTAFELLVDESLAADESFRIFITLSNDVLQQLEGRSNRASSDS